MRSDRARCEVAVFDCDGTLANTFEAIRAATEVALTAHGLPLTSLERLKSSVGLSLPTIFDRITGGVLSAAEIDDLVRVYRSVFTEIAAAKVTLFDGIGEQLDLLHDAGVTLTVATSKSRRGVTELLDVLGIADMFAVVVADDMVSHKKPHPQMCEQVMAAVGGRPERATMIGDAIYDIQMGRAAGLRTCAVTWGNQTREQLLAAEPDHIVETPAELADVLIGEAALSGRLADPPASARRTS